MNLRERDLYPANKMRAMRTRISRKLLFLSSVGSLCLLMVLAHELSLLKGYWNVSTRVWTWSFPASNFEATISEANMTYASDQLFGNPDIKQDDERLIAYIKQRYIFPPPKQPRKVTDYVVSDPSEFKQQLELILNTKKNGFFIECGANDGVFLSNTYKLENVDGWTGLLIEANPYIFPNLRSRQRNAWISNACISMEAFPKREKFIHRVASDIHSTGHGMIAPGSPGNPWHAVHSSGIRNSFVDAGLVDCFPLYSLLLAINVTTVDYFSVDVEMIEYKVLKNIPFDKVIIKVISVEHNRIPEGKAALVEMLQQNGYESVFETHSEIFFMLSKFKNEFFKE